jgi:predicted enzyme related to lactoylglutathione lyase
MAKKAARKKATKKAGRKAAKKATSKRKPGKKKPIKKKPTKKKVSAAKSKTAKKKTAKKRATVKGKPGSKAAKSTALAYPNHIGFVRQHVDFLTYKVEQLRKFYGDVLGFPTEQGDSTLNYLFVNTSATSSIGFMPPHPRMTGEQPPPKESTLYFIVEDVDKVFARLMAKGVAFMGPPQEMPWGHRVIMAHDPEGRTVMLGSPSKKE